jgi:4-aminobutyrate aminotransferase
VTTHADLLARHQAVLPSWLSLYYDQPIELVSGEGRHVTDGEGRRYLDFFGGILTTMTGHAVPEVVEAIREQAGRMLHSSTLYLIRPMVELAERISSLSGLPDAKVFFVNSGSEANDTALQLASTLRRSNQILALRNSYHGRSFASMAVTGIRSWSSSSLTPLNVSYVQGGYRYRSPFGHLSDPAYIDACAADLRDVIETTTAGDVGAMIIEPIQGVGGFITPPDGLLAAYKAVLDEYGILLVVDEVQTGWGRTGEHFWGYQAHGVVPDLLTFAKGVGNGLAIAGVVGRAEVIDSVTANSISTFGGNPLASAGALANLDYLLSHDLQANAAAQGTRLFGRIAPLVDKLSILGEVRGKGLMMGIELVVPGGREPNPVAATAALEATRAAGLLIGKGGMKGNVLRIAPPLSVTTEEIDTAADILVDALAGVDALAVEVGGGGGGAGVRGGGGVGDVDASAARGEVAP